MQKERTLQILVDTLVAGRPRAVRHTETLAGGGQVDVVDNVVKVVAERAVARLANVVDVDVARVGQADGHNLVAVIERIGIIAILDVRLARLVLVLGRLHRDVADLIVVVQERSIRRRLDQRISPTVADSNALQVDLVATLLVHLPDVVRDGGDVVAGIGLTCVIGKFCVSLSNIREKCTLTE